MQDQAQLVADLYDISHDEFFLERLADLFPNRLGGEAIHTTIFDKDFVPRVSVTTPYAAHLIKKFGDYAHLDPRAANCWSKPDRIFSCLEMAPLELMERSAFVNEFLEGQDINMRWMAGGYFNVNPGMKVTFGVLRQRKRGPFVSDEINPTEFIFPHVTRILKLRLTLAELGLWGKTLEATLDQVSRGIIVVASDSRILYANKIAEAYVRSASCLRAQNGRLTTTQHRQSDKLSRMIADLAESRNRISVPANTFVITDHNGTATYLIKAWPLPFQSGTGQALAPLIQLTIDAIKRDIKLPYATKKIFDLSPREMQVAQGLCDGESTRSIATKLGIKFDTARGYVKALLSKTGVNSQKDLVLLLARLAE